MTAVAIPPATAAPADTAPVSVAAADPDALYAALTARAATLLQGAIGAADALAADIVQSALPETTFKPLAGAIAKATGLDGDMLRRKMLKARGASDTAGDDAAMEAPCADDPEPSTSPAPLGNALRASVSVIRQRVFCAAEVADACALWAMGTWGVYPPGDPAAGPDIYPRLHIHAPAKRCGKSLLLESVSQLVRRPLMATDVSEAAVFRTIGKYRPTLLIDEADQLFAKNRDLTGIVNSGYARTGHVVRTVEVQAQGLRSFEPVSFPTFGAVALAGIGALPSTIEDRSIRIELHRQPRDRRAQRVGLRQLADLRKKITPHLMAHADAIGAAMTAGVPDGEIPAPLNDRDADNWRPLLGLAKLAGAEWLARAQRAAEVLCAAGADGDKGNEWALRQVVEFVREKRAAVVAEWRAWVRGGRKTVRPLAGRPGVQRPAVACRFVPSDELAGWLLAKDDSGFADMRDAGSVKLRVARLLRGFGVQPTLRRVNGVPTRGYEVPPIRAVWRSYRP